MFKKAKEIEEDDDVEEGEEKKEKRPAIMIMIGMTKKNESDREDRAKKITGMLKGNKK